MEQATRLFYYTYCVKEILDNMNSAERRLSDVNKGKYIEDLLAVKEIATEKKKKEVDNLIRIVEQYHSVVSY